MHRIKLPWIFSATVAVCGFTLAAGCQKEAPESPASTNAADAVPAGQEAQPAQPQAPTPTVTAPAPDHGQALAGVQAAMNEKNYDKAAELMINLQNATRQPLTQQQAAAIANKMRELQQYVMNGVASGDPSAIAAAKRIRAASTPR